MFILFLLLFHHEETVGILSKLLVTCLLLFLLRRQQITEKHLHFGQTYLLFICYYLFTYLELHKKIFSQLAACICCLGVENEKQFSFSEIFEISHGVCANFIFCSWATVHDIIFPLKLKFCIVCANPMIILWSKTLIILLGYKFDPSLFRVEVFIK